MLYVIYYINIFFYINLFTLVLNLVFYFVYNIICFNICHFDFKLISFASIRVFLNTIKLLLFEIFESVKMFLLFCDFLIIEA